MAIAKYNQIYLNDKWRVYQPYVYHDGSWQKALTNIYTNEVWNEIGQPPWVLWDDAQGGQVDENTSWQKAKFTTLVNGIDITANTSLSNNRMRVYRNNMTTGYWYGGNWSTTETVYVPESATYLKVTYFKDADASAYSRTNIGLILPTASNSFDTSGGGQTVSRPLSPLMSGSTIYTLSLTLSDNVKGTNDFVVSLTGWMQNNSASPNTTGDLYFKKVWFE